MYIYMCVCIYIYMGFTLPETNMEPKKGPIKTTALLKGDYRVSMLVWGSVGSRVYGL